MAHDPISRTKINCDSTEQNKPFFLQKSNKYTLCKNACTSLIMYTSITSLSPEKAQINET